MTPLEVKCRVGVHNVVASDVRALAAGCWQRGTFVTADVQDKETLERIVKEHGITHIVHLATLLSGQIRRNEIQLGL